MDKNKVFYTRKLSALKKRFALTSVFSFAVCCFLTALCLFSPSVRASVPLSLRLLFILAVGCMCLLLIFALRIGYRLTDKIAAIYTLPDVTFPEPPHRMNTVMLLGLLLENMETIHSRQYQYQLLQKEAQLDAMQSQIQPHFLYNALDSIRGLALAENALQTAEMTEALSVFYRNSIGKPTKMLTLGQEIRNVENYVKIQRFRFGERFELVKEFSPEAECLFHTYYLPKLTIQPVVENAIYHGIDRQAAGGIITLSLTATQSRLIISVKDNGQGMPEQTLLLLNQSFRENAPCLKEQDENKHTGIALANINSRIRMIYGDKYGLTAYSLEGLGSEFQIILPLKTSAETAESEVGLCTNYTV